MSALLFKATRTGGHPTHASGVTFVWPKPSGQRPGKWTEPVPNIRLCARGYHLTDADHLIDWLSDELWVAEGRGPSIAAPDKMVFESARLVRRLPWDEKVARLFAADCAEHVLHLFENERPQDMRPRQAIQAARDYANSVIEAAAWDAAWAAAGAAARAAARAAERQWQTQTLLSALGVSS